MNAAELLSAALGPLVGGRAYPSRFPQPSGNAAPTWPALRYTVTAENPATSLCGSDPEADSVIVRIDVVAADYASMRTLKAQVVAALENTDPVCTRQPGGFEVYDVETKTHRALLEYLFHPSSADGSPA